MLGLLLSLFVSAPAEARSIQLPMKHYAQIVNISMDDMFPTSTGTVTYLKGCGDFNPTLELSEPVTNPRTGLKVIKLRVELSTHAVAAVCLAMPTEQQLNFTVNTMDGPVKVVANSDFKQSQTVKMANLNKFYFQPGSELAKEQIKFGTVVVDRKQKQIVLTLVRSMPICPEGMFCIESMPAPIIISLPLKSVQVGGCNEVIYYAEVNHMPVDGLLSSITVTEQRKSLCRYYVAVAPTEVQMRTAGGRPKFEEIHTMQGDSLKLQ